MRSENRPDLFAALKTLSDAEAARLDAIEELRRLGYIRTRSVVAEIGEAYAAAFYGVRLEPGSNPGFDLVARDMRKIQVKTLRCTPENYRASMGPMKDPYDTLFALRLNPDYSPIKAIEVPRKVLEQHYLHGTRTTWTKRLEEDDGVTQIGGAEIMRKARSNTRPSSSRAG